MRAALAILCLALAGPVSARNLCGLTDAGEILAAVVGSWEAEEAISLESATTSLLRHPAPAREVVTADGRLETDFLDDTGGGPVALSLAWPAPYDVDRVDDVLETTESAAFADTLSDTRCGPADLPQLAARIDTGGDMSAEGTVTLVAYFDDRMLRITELTLRGGGAVVFLTGTALLTRDR